MYIDHLLLEIQKRGFEKLTKLVPSRDLKILKSLSTTVSSSLFITKNQSRLLLKILNENKENLITVKEIIDQSLENPLWSKNFRPVDTTKRIFVNRSKDGTVSLAIEFAFNANIKKSLLNLSKIIEGSVQTFTNRINLLDLTERNIVTVVENFEKHDFEISDEIRDFYKTIKSWNFHEISEKLEFNNFLNSQHQRLLINDIGQDGLEDSDLVEDRRIKFQYNVALREKTEKTIKNTIISRSGTKVWVDSNEHSLDDLIQTLKNLKRLPVLITWEHNVEKTALEILKKLDSSLKKCEIFDGVGIYFRLDNSEIGKEFNNLIATNKYNAVLDEHTKIACVPNGKIPKFFIKNQWKPNAVISIGTALRYSKTAVYANCCDLIVTYHHSPALIENFKTL